MVIRFFSHFESFLGSGPEGVDDLCFHTYGEFSQIPREWNLGLGVGIWALRVGFGPQDWDLGLETGIWASGLEFEGGT